MIEFIIFIVFISIISLFTWTVCYSIMMAKLADSAMKAMGKVHMMSKMMDYGKDD